MARHAAPVRLVATPVQAVDRDIRVILQIDSPASIVDWHPW
jgi:hypothetical protein